MSIIELPSRSFRTPFEDVCGLPNPGASPSGSTYWRRVQRCPREHFLANVLKWDPVPRAQALDVGLLWHACLERASELIGPSEDEDGRDVPGSGVPMQSMRVTSWKGVSEVNDLDRNEGLFMLLLGVVLVLVMHALGCGSAAQLVPTTPINNITVNSTFRLGCTGADAPTAAQASANEDTATAGPSSIAISNDVWVAGTSAEAKPQTQGNEITTDTHVDTNLPISTGGAATTNTAPPTTPTPSPAAAPPLAIDRRSQSQ